jgi:large subunit ribosomal protein L19
MEIKPGMTVKVHQKIKETTPKGEEKERIQVYEGMVLKVRGGGLGKTMTVRKISFGIGVEKIFPLNLPSIAKIEPIKQAAVRKAKLYHLRDSKKRLKETAIAPEKK